MESLAAANRSRRGCLPIPVLKVKGRRAMKAARRFRAGLEPLEGRQVLSALHYHPVAVVGGGVAVQTSNVPQ